MTKGRNPCNDLTRCNDLPRRNDLTATARTRHLQHAESTEGPHVSVDCLTCNHARNPLGVDDPGRSSVGNSTPASRGSTRLPTGSLRPARARTLTTAPMTSGTRARLSRPTRSSSSMQAGRFGPARDASGVLWSGTKMTDLLVGAGRPASKWGC